MTDKHQRDRIMQSAKYVCIVSFVLYLKYQKKYCLPCLINLLYIFTSHCNNKCIVNLNNK